MVYYNTFLDIQVFVYSFTKFIHHTIVSLFELDPTEFPSQCLKEWKNTYTKPVVLENTWINYIKPFNLISCNLPFVVRFLNTLSAETVFIDYIRQDALLNLYCIYVLYTGYIMLFRRLLYRRDFGDSCARFWWQLCRQDNFKCYSRIDHDFVYFLLHYWFRKLQRTNLGWLLREKFSYQNSSKVVLHLLSWNLGASGQTWMPLCASHFTWAQHGASE